MTVSLKGDGLPTGSVTRLYVQASAGNGDAVCQLIERLSPIVHEYCRRRFGPNASATKSGTDFANEAMASFHGDLTEARIETGLNRKALVDYIVGLAWKKHLHHHRSENTKKRGAGKVVHVSALDAEDALEYQQAIKFVEPETLDANCRELLDSLPEDLCLIAIRRLQGYILRDIASELGCHASSVKRKLAMIRAQWGQFLR